MNPIIKTRRQDQFLIEQRLRQTILNSDHKTRPTIVAAAYAELFDQFPDHGAFRETDDLESPAAQRRAGMITPLAQPGYRVLEVGCGDGRVLATLARNGCECVGIEPSEHMVRLARRRNTVRIESGVADHLEFPDQSFDLVFSQQMLEHLHPQDVPGHFTEAFRVLKPGGTLAVETPNQRTGPQDISRGFTPKAQGLHLKEWTLQELHNQFHQTGFTRIRGILIPPYIARRSPKLFRWSQVPSAVRILQDRTLGCIPHLEFRTLIARIIGLNDLFLFARKPERGVKSD